jgi:hypothetical protein
MPRAVPKEIFSKSMAESDIKLIDIQSKGCASFLPMETQGIEAGRTV